MRRILILAILFLGINAWSQNDTLIVDQVVARVGDRIILQSDIEAQYSQILNTGQAPKYLKCQILEELLTQKLLLNQADIDSVYVSDDELDAELNARLQLFIDQMGGVEKMEDYFHKSIFEIKEDLKRVLKDQIRAQRMKNQLTEDIKITPSEVHDYYNSLPKDSLPIVDQQVEVQQIVIKPKITPEQEKAIIDRLKQMREQVLSGKKKFQTLAILYSDDPGSASKGGELGFRARAELVPEFASVAFSLKPGQVSDVVKTKFGYHILQLIERKGERVNVRHILIVPKPTPDEIVKARKLADSVYNLIVNDSLTFEQAALKYSDDEDTKNNGGLLINPMNGTAKFKMEELPPYIRFDIKDLEPGQISKPMQTVDNTGQLVFKIYKLKSRTEPHIANPEQDYQLIMDMALRHKKQVFMDQWIKDQLKKTYVHIDPYYQDCKFHNPAWLKYNQEEE